jgi:hypothetical protein
MLLLPQKYFFLLSLSLSSISIFFIWFVLAGIL